MAILTLSCRETSLEYFLFQSPSLQQLAWGKVEGIGRGEQARWQSDHNGQSEEVTLPILPTLHEAIRFVNDQLMRTQVVGEAGGGSFAIDSIGHRVVHGGEIFQHSVAINEQVLEQIRRLERLAPKYNCPNREGIEAALCLWPAALHVAIFDTAFHQTLPASAYIYPLPYVWYKNHGVRRYGFHGPSHLYLSRRAAALMSKPHTQSKVVTIHMELGISLCAIANGRSVDISMGFTPVDGAMQERRSGTVDPGIPGFIMDWQELSAQQVEEILNEKSGLSGIVGQCSGRREVMERAYAGEERPQLAMAMETHGLKKYLGAYLAALGGCDAIVFSTGQGDLEARARQQFLQGLECFGVYIDEQRNVNSELVHGARLISRSDSPIQIWVIPTREHRVYAEDTALVSSGCCTEPWRQSYSFDHVDRA